METFPTAVLGYRAFRIVGGGLYPLNDFPAWPRADMLAICHGGYPHSVPDLDCQCGLYACYTLAGAKQYASSFEYDVIAIVAGAGDTCVHEEGFRSEKMQIIQLLGDTEMIKQTAERYKVAFGTEQIELPASLATVPASIRPQDTSEERKQILYEDAK